MGFFYNNLDSLIRWEIDSVLAMTPDQEAFFESEFAVLWRWHRTHELPRYADDLERWAERFGGAPAPAHDATDCGEPPMPKEQPVGPKAVSSCFVEADIDELLVTLEGWWLRLEAQGTPFAAEYLRRFEEGQVALLAQALEESNADWEKDEKGKPLDAIRNGWRKDFEAILKRFTGPPTAEQRALIADAADRYQPERQLWADYRRRWQSDLFALLEHRREADDFGERFARLVKSQKTYYGEQFAEVEAANEALVKSALVAVLNQAPPRQRQRLRETLVERAVELRKLAAAAQDA